MTNPSGRDLIPSVITIDSDFNADAHRYVTGHFVSSEKIEFWAR